MTVLKFNPIEVEELETNELLELNGGTWWIKAVAAVTTGPIGGILAVVSAIDAVQDIGSGIAEGYQYGRSHKH